MRSNYVYMIFGTIRLYFMMNNAIGRFSINDVIHSLVTSLTYANRV